jgi:hypothetical protein
VRLRRDVPVAVEVEGALAEERLAFLFEEAGGLVAVRIEAGEASAPAPALGLEALGRALGRPVREVVTLDLASL